MGTPLQSLAGLSPEQRALLANKLARGRAPAQEAAGGGPAPGASFHCALAAPGNFAGIRFVDRAPTAPAPGQIQLRVRAMSLNFRDLMMAMGTYPPTAGVPSVMGSDYAGEIAAVGEGVTGFAPGDRVMALSAGHCDRDGRIVDGMHLASVQNLSALQVAPIPADLAFEAAAGVPTVFLTTYHALHEVARLQAGERVLIHSATGGVGMAAIQVARWLGARIYATAGSEEKRRRLEALGIEAPMDSRSLAFAGQIAERTGGEGVDVVLNTLPGAALAAGLDCLGGFGRFLQIEKQALFSDTPMSLAPFKKGLTFAAIDLALFVSRPARLNQLLREISLHLERGDFAPVAWRAWPVAELGQALTVMSRATHTGKLVLRYD